MSLSEQKKLILTNQISVLLFLILIILLIIVTILTSKFNIISFFVCSLILSIPILNQIGLYRFTSFMMSSIFPINVIIFSTISKVQIVTGSLDIVYHFTPRFLLLGGLVLPLILIDIRHKWFLIAALLINLSCVILYDPLCEKFGVGINDVTIIYEKYKYITWFMLLPWSLILVGFMFLQNINNKYEKQVINLNNDLTSKNLLLSQQNEEIASQRDALEQLNTEVTAQRDEIEAQRDLVTSQKEQIEIIHNEVSQSIDYATRLQSAILPNSEILNKIISENFILYKPKDKVSGDFYWWAMIDNHLIITVADCTGHGVPGAFMSMLGTSFLREIVVKEYMTDPAIILKRLRKEIIQALKQKESRNEQKENLSAVRDGMDMALVSINIDTLELQYAGANNPLYIFDNHTKELKEISPDKMPVSIHENMTPYTNQYIQLRKGNHLYLMSDGYEDQFGGPKNKKFMVKQLKELFVTISDKPMNEQQKILNTTFENWKGQNEQIDDVTVLGLKI